MKVDVSLLKKLRIETKVSLADCRKALEDSSNDYTKAKKKLIEMGIQDAVKKEKRKTQAGIVESYIHANGKIGVIVELCCETDFVARTQDFKSLAHEIALEIAALAPADTKKLLSSVYIRDTSKTIQDIVIQAISRLGENITVSRFQRFELGVK